MNLWKPTPGSLYPALEELKKEKLIEVKSIDSSGRKKKIYAITAVGRKKVKGFATEKANFEKGFIQLLENPEFSKYTCDDFMHLQKIISGIFEGEAKEYKSTLLEFAFLAKQGEISEKQKKEFKKNLISLLEKIKKINESAKKQATKNLNTN